MNRFQSGFNVFYRFCFLSLFNTTAPRLGEMRRLYDQDSLNCGRIVPLTPWSNMAFSPFLRGSGYYRPVLDLKNMVTGLCSKGGEYA
jgi:hypothetical protein